MNNKKGFTLIELIIVIAILAILSLILVPSFMGYAKDAKAAGCLSNRTNIERLFRYYEAKHPQEVITLTQYLTKVDGENDIAEFKCPSGGVYSVDTNDQHVVACSEHSETTADIPSGGKINGTDLDYSNIIEYKDNDIARERLDKGSIILLEKNGIKKQYVVLTDIGNGNPVFSTDNLIELSTDKALELDSSSLNDSYFNKNIKKGTKVLYNKKYYIAISNPWGGAPEPGSSSTFWLEIKDNEKKG